MPTHRERFLVRAVREEAALRGIGITTFSANWVIRLEKGERREYVFGYHFPLNSATAAMLARDKAAASDALASAQVPHVDHRLFLRPDPSGLIPASADREGMSAYAAQHGGTLVAKPNEGTGGGGVTLVRSQLELETAVDQLFSRHRAISLSPYLTIEREVRLVMLEGACRLAYEKVRTDSEEWRHNLALGAVPRVLDDLGDVHAALLLAERAVAALELRFAALDVVAVAGEWSVLEANAGIMMESFAGRGEREAALAAAVYGAALDLMFE